MIEKKIYLVTHGITDVRQDNPNPGMTEEGIRQIRDLRSKLDEILVTPIEIHVGTGLRQHQVVQALGFEKHPYIFYSAIYGEAATTIMIDGDRKILLSTGQIIDSDQYLSPMHGRDSTRQAIINMQGNSLISSGRPVLIRLGVPLEDCYNASIYILNVFGDDIRVELIVRGIRL